LEITFSAWLDPKQLESLKELWAEYVKETAFHGTQRLSAEELKARPIAVALSGNQAVGFLYGSAEAGKPYSWYVHSGYRGHEIGRELMEHFIERAAQYGHSEIKIEPPFSIRGKKALERMGGEARGRNVFFPTRISPKFRRRPR